MNQLKIVQLALKKGLSCHTIMHSETLEIIEDNANDGMKNLTKMIEDWSKGGVFHEYMVETYKIDLKVVGGFYQVKAMGQYAHLSDTGITGISIAINN